MLVMPIILTGIMFSCLALVVMGITGIEVNTNRNDNSFYNAMRETEDFANLTDLQNMKAEVDRFNDIYKHYSINVAIYEGETLIYPASANVIDSTRILLSEDGEYLIVDGNNAVFSRHAGEYTLILSSTNFSRYTQSPLNEYFYLGIFIFLFAIIMVFIINRALTRFVTNKITAPIDILVSGVHELRDGNLNYRIQYDYNDEFKQVCNDFNEMAQQLNDMVAARQRDEQNRKELIAGISHDLRTPLTSIKAYIEGIEKGVASTPQTQKRYLNTIKGKTEDLEHIINQLFIFSKLDIGEFPLHLERIEVGKALSDFCSQAVSEYEEKGLTLSLINNPNRLFTNIDVVQMRSILSNILENSVKYKISDNVKSEIVYGEKDNNIIITITDDGSGVPDENIDKLFDVFYRGDDSRKDPSSGSGLGLAITRKIVERFGGTIHAKNAGSGGLAITITLPRSGGGA